VKGEHISDHTFFNIESTFQDIEALRLKMEFERRQSPLIITDNLIFLQECLLEQLNYLRRKRLMNSNLSYRAVAKKLST